MLENNPESIKNCKNRLANEGFFKDRLTLSSATSSAVMAKDFNKVDQIFKEQTSPDGYLFKYLKQFREFSEIEFIISLRDAKNEWEEDGIWHDDGSRIMAFSLSLTYDAHCIVGGDLHIRPKGSTDASIIKPFEFGEIVVFLTGTSGFEHKIHEVKKGERLIIAGWCS